MSIENDFYNIELIDSLSNITSPLSFGSLKHPGSRECFPWTSSKKPCSLMTKKKSYQSGQSAGVRPPRQKTPTPIFPQLGPVVLRCPLADKARAEHPMAAERAVPYFFSCKFGDTVNFLFNSHFICMGTNAAADINIVSSKQ